MQGKREIWRWLARAAAWISAAAVLAVVCWLFWHYLEEGTRMKEEQAGEVESALAEVDAKDRMEMDGSGEQQVSGSRQDEPSADGPEELSIRVRILGDDYGTPFHQKVTVTSDSAFRVEKGDSRTLCGAGEWYSVTAGELAEGERCTVASPSAGALVLPELVRAQESPAYGGKLLLCGTSDGILLVNELPLEDYLCSVVASEMPSDYPAEAQKAQAVCARTYAALCRQREKNEDSLYDLDDSVADQVYNNQKATAASSDAVAETRGEILDVQEVQYYSTSCGDTGQRDLSEEDCFADFLAEVPEEDAEYGSPWLRWQLFLTETQLLENLRAGWQYRGEQVEELEVTKRSSGGQAEILRVSGDGGTLAISGEYEIRKALAPGSCAVTLRSGQSVEGLSMLPSAWFRESSSDEGKAAAFFRSTGEDVKDGEFSTESVWEKEPSEGESAADGSTLSDTDGAQERVEDGTKRGFLLCGAGYGHGRGMSQYQAAAMAADGADYREILDYFYGESELLNE